MGAGLGGGSSDGATAMKGLSRLWAADFAPDRLAELSARCGSDLPFFFHGGSSICTGRGEFVKPTPPPAVRWGVLVLPKIAMPTPAVYRKFDELKLGDDAPLNDSIDWIACAKLPSEPLLAMLVNDLEKSAFALCPALGNLRRDIELQLSRPVRMSGSGSSLFSLFDTRDEAQRAALDIAATHKIESLAIELASVIDDDLNVMRASK